MIILVILYFIIRLPNLTLLPVFTDEANYIDWGWRETHVPGHLFYSLYDAKQPLLMWFFGLSQNIFSDPLFAGRIISVFTGLITLIGLYKLSLNLFNKHVALLSSTFYFLSPIFHLYDRQALMESSLAAVGVWSAYLLFNLLSRPRYLTSLLLGAVLGIGFFIKSSALIFALSALFTITIHCLLHRRQAVSLLTHIIFSGLAFLLVTSPLLFQPQFWQTLNLNSRYSLNVSQLLTFPFLLWWSNFKTAIDIIFWHLTPPVFILGLVGLYKSFKSPSPLSTLYFLFPLLFQIFVATFIVHRYLAPFLPLFLIFAAHALSRLSPLSTLHFPLSTFYFLLPLTLTLTLTFSPISYFRLMSKVTRYSYIEGYVTAEASGYNVAPAVDYFKNLARKEPFVLGLGLYSGNPETGLMIYLRDHPDIKVSYFDAQLFGSKLDGIDCFSSDKPIYLATRDKNAAGLSKYVDPLTQITNPVSDSILYVFQLKQNCTGKTLNLTLTSNFKFNLIGAHS